MLSENHKLITRFEMPLEIFFLNNNTITVYIQKKSISLLYTSQ